MFTATKLKFENTNNKDLCENSFSPTIGTDLIEKKKWNVTITIAKQHVGHITTGI